MAHYAFLDENNIVTEVIVGKDEDIDETIWEEWYSNFRGQKCKRTSYNTYGNRHLLGGTPFRKNYAGIGFTYDEQLDAFVPPKPFESWVLDQQTCLWKPPTEYPTDGLEYYWNEEDLCWNLVEN